MAGLGYSLDFTTRGVRLSFGGFGDKMPDFMNKVAEAVATHAPSDPAEFERLRDVVSTFLKLLMAKEEGGYEMRVRSWGGGKGARGWGAGVIKNPAWFTFCCWDLEATCRS